MPALRHPAAPLFHPTKVKRCAPRKEFLRARYDTRRRYLLPVYYSGLGNSLSLIAGTFQAK